MKILHISDKSDEGAQPGSESLVFRGHTYAAVITGDQLSYDYHHYFPERAMSSWLDTPNGSVCQISKEKGIEGIALDLECDVYDVEFQPSTYFGLSSTNRRGNMFNGYCLLPECTDSSASVFDREYVTNAYNDFNEKPIAQFEGYLGCGVWFDGYYVASLISDGLIIAIDSDFNMVWKRKFLNKDIGCTVSKLFQYSSITIARLGQLPGTDIKSQIISLDTKTGNTVWNIDLPFYVNHCILIGDRLYLSSALDWNWCVVSADTGDIILQGKVTLPEVHNRIGWLWADSGYLFLDYHSESLHVMDGNTGELIQDVALPDEFSLSSYPEVKDDYIYFRLGTSGEICEFNAYGGVMILSREELRQGPPWTIEVEDKGDISYQAIVDGKTEYYEINASYEELGDVLRFGQIEIKLVAQRYAYNHWGNLDDNWRTRINKKFDGRIVLNIDKAKLRNPDEAKFDLMVELFNKHFEKKFRAPANKKKPLTLIWKYI